jgi:hypothetical protein
MRQELKKIVSLFSNRYEKIYRSDWTKRRTRPTHSLHHCVVIFFIHLRIEIIKNESIFSRVKPTEYNFFNELGNISPIHTFVNIPALIRKRSVFLSSRAGILTKV